MPSPPCPEKESLTQRLNQARLQYAAATNQLETMEVPAFQELLRKAQSAKLTYESARTALEAHVQSHGC
jgi:hypothetical protein